MSEPFPGVFAGKTVFCSTRPGGQNYYLTTCRVSDGNHGWLFWPGLNATAVNQVEKFLLYLYPDGLYRIQSGDLRWLYLNHAQGFLTYGADPVQAAAFSLSGSPFGTSWGVQTGSGLKPVIYQIQDLLTSPNLLTVNEVAGDFSTFTPSLITPGLADVRQQKQAKNGDFGNAILLGQDLSQGIDFSGASFVGAQLAGANFNGATLDRADLSQTNLQGFNWGQPASAIGINLSGSNAAGCVFGNSGNGQNQLNCTAANLAGANLSGANLANLNLQGAQLGSANLVGAKLDYANLISANMNGVVAVRCSFVHAMLTDATAQMGIFIQAIFDHAVLTRIRMGASSFLFLLNSNFVNELNSSTYPQSDLIGAFRQNGIVLNPSSPIDILIPKQRWQINDPSGPYKLALVDTGIQVFNASPNLVPAVLTGASLVGTQASTASLAGADLRGVRWMNTPATLDHADLEDAALSGALLVSTDFTQSNLSGADFSNSVLIQAKFAGCIAGPGANSRAISFESAHLEGADFSKSTFNGAILTNAVVALDAGAPLLFLPLTDQQYLTTGGLARLKPAFTAVGFDLGTAPVLTNTSSWIIDNSQSTDPRSPRQYTVIPSGNGFQVFGNGGGYLFLLPAGVQNLLNQPFATMPLVNMFTTASQRQDNLALNAPITIQGSWTIHSDQNAVFLKPYSFPKMAIQLEATRLVVYGVPPVLIQNLPGFPDGVAFSATVNLDGAWSANVVGPAGLPFTWIGQGMVDEAGFYLPVGN